MKKSKSKSKTALELSPHMLPTSDPPIKRPLALRWMLVIFAAWLIFLVMMASERL